MKEISIFIDESGDFGKLNPHSPYYIVTMVFHEQAKSLSVLPKSTPPQNVKRCGIPVKIILPSHNNPPKTSESLANI